MTETRRRSGGRAARQAARMRAHVKRVPFLTRTLAYLNDYHTELARRAYANQA